ncbi:hypothetical protein [Micromonospora rubida]|uniref:hypothetical protein n=1 Tax=Micromonospora rubida TaxID=2697657 RepID=UPI001378B9F0|nr:hypothetical protein [Micromonospora rubida]NBE84298.1 hypothetical protein [Micromonospora rubida]
MTAPFLSLAQIRNRLTLTARTILRQHRPGRDGRCPVCRLPHCPAATTAQHFLATIRRTSDGVEVQQRGTATGPLARNRNEPW